MAEFDPSHLRNIWYYALPSIELKAGKMIAKTLLGEPILFARTKGGQVFALRDVCPHRAMPLSKGWFDGERVQCCYHGWVFDKDGVCQDIPWLLGHENVDPTKVKVRSYPVHEAQGNIWIFMGEKAADTPESTGQKPPAMPGFTDAAKPDLWSKSVFRCPFDYAVIGLMDSGHVPYVHASWWWRSKTSLHEKAKAFGPWPFGFVMKKHTPSKNSLGYKILGGKPETEISFELPGVRMDHVSVGKDHVINMTCVTPIDDNSTEITHLIYWTQPWLFLIKPIIWVFMKMFIEQDRHAIELQQEGLKHEKAMLLFKDVDTLARWYFQLKSEYRASVQGARAFSNPVPDVTLRWRS